MIKEINPIEYLIYVSDLKDYSRLGQTSNAKFFLTRASSSGIFLVFLTLESTTPKSHRFQNFYSCGYLL